MKLTQDILKLQMKNKKKLWGFLSNLVEGIMAFIISLKRAICKKVWETLPLTILSNPKFLKYIKMFIDTDVNLYLFRLVNIKLH